MDWKSALLAARNEHRQLTERRDELDAQRADIDVEAETVDKRLLQLQQTIASLSELVGESYFSKALTRSLSLDHLKLADACRQVLMSSNIYWTPIAVRDALVLQKYNLTASSNPLASIHAVLKRLHESGEVVRTAGPDGKAMYRWKFFVLGKAFTKEDMDEGERKRAEVRTIMESAKKKS
jgi:hypothetical protein